MIVLFFHWLTCVCRCCLLTKMFLLIASNSLFDGLEKSSRLKSFTYHQKLGYAREGFISMSIRETKVHRFSKENATSHEFQWRIKAFYIHFFRQIILSIINFDQLLFSPLTCKSCKSGVSLILFSQ